VSSFHHPDPDRSEITLAERLRIAADKSANGGGEWYQLIHRCREAADEIERLSGENEALRVDLAWGNHRIDDMEAQIERLRVALGELRTDFGRIADIAAQHDCQAVPQP